MLLLRMLLLLRRSGLPLWRSSLALRLRCSLPLWLWCGLTLLLRSSLTLRLWCCLTLLLRCSLALLLLLRHLALLLHLRHLALLRLRLRHLARLLLRCRLALLLLLRHLALLLRLHGGHLMLLLHRGHLMLLLRHPGRLALLLRLLHPGRLALLLLLLAPRHLMLLLLLHRGRLMLLLLHPRLLMLLLLRHPGLLLLLERPLVLCLHRLALTLLVLCVSLVARLDLRRHADIVIGLKGLVDGHAGRAAMVDIGKLSPVAASNVLVLELRPHGRSMLLVASRQLGGPGSDLQPTRSAVEADTDAAPVLVAHWAVIDVVYDVDVDIVVRTVVVEMAAAPVAALVAKSYIAKAVVHAAIVADVGTPVAAVKAVAVMVIAPIARGPKSALVGSLDPHAGHPVISAITPSPVAGRPEVVVAGSGRLVVFGQRRGRLIRVFNRLSAIAGIVRALVIVLVGSLVGGLAV